MLFIYSAVVCKLQLFYFETHIVMAICQQDANSVQLVSCDIRKIFLLGPVKYHHNLQHLRESV